MLLSRKHFSVGTNAEKIEIVDFLKKKKRTSSIVHIKQFGQL